MSQHAAPNRNWRSLLPGLVMMAIGTVFLLERFDYLSLRRAWQLWPMILVVFGLGNLLRPGDGRRSVLLLLVGVWLQISMLGLWGLDFGDSWPLLIVFIGASFVFDALVGGPRSGRVAARVVIDAGRQGESDER